MHFFSPKVSFFLPTFYLKLYYKITVFALEPQSHPPPSTSSLNSALLQHHQEAAKQIAAMNLGTATMAGLSSHNAAAQMLDANALYQSAAVTVSFTSPV